MKIPAVPPVRPAALVRPNQEIETWSPINIGASTGLTPAQASSIDGMTLETSRRLTAAVTNLAAFLSSDPEFADIVNAQADSVTPVSAASTSPASSTATAHSASDTAQAIGKAQTTDGTGAARTTRTPVATASNGAAGMSDEVDASRSSNPTRGAGAPGNSDPADTFSASDASASGSRAQTARASTTSRATGSTEATGPADSTSATETADANNLNGAARDFVIPDAAEDEPAGGPDTAYIPSPNESREGDDALDAGATIAEPSGKHQNAASAEDQPFAALSNDTQIDQTQRGGDSSAGGVGDECQDCGGGWNDIEGAAIAIRQQGALPLVPFNRRLETNGVDQTALLAGEFSAPSHAYGGHDLINWIVPLTIGAPRMSTDGGASPPPIFAAEEEAQSDDGAQPALSVSPRPAAPFILMSPAPARSRPKLRRRQVRIAGRHQRMPWIGARYRAPRMLTDSFLSDLRCIGVVECAACWVVRGSDRREQFGCISAHAPV